MANYWESVVGMIMFWAQTKQPQIVLGVLLLGRFILLLKGLPIVGSCRRY